MRDVRVAAVCMASTPGDVEGNLRKTERFVQEAWSRGAEIVCFPELSIHGYSLRRKAEHPRDQEGIIRRIEDLAQSRGLLILAGLIGSEQNQRPFICQVAAGPGGLIGIYRKTHLSPAEKEMFSPGEEISPFRALGISFGIQLCYETHFPEITTVLALEGAEVLFVPHASPRGTPEEKLQSWMRHLPSRAFDNGLFVVACNQTGGSAEGLSFPGVALALDPTGRLMAGRAEEQEGMLIVDLKAEDLAQTRNHRMKYFLPFRRPELYVEVAARKSET
jgi:N-carbamoylputrescine amidase